MNVWIVNPFDNLPLEGARPQRYWLMARAFAAAGHRVTLWTSDFSHARKAKRTLVRPCGGGDADKRIAVRMIPTLPYPTNVCWARVRSHRRLARDFERAGMALADVQPAPRANGSGADGQKDLQPNRPALVIASAPPLGLCTAAMRVARKYGAMFVCDIQDAWPETFERILPRFVWTIFGVRRVARRLYCGADRVSAVARRYLELARAYGSRVPMREFGHAIAVEQTEGESRDPAGKEVSPAACGALRLVYAGNMSLSYDLGTVIEAVAGLTDVTLDVAGDGPDRERLEAKALEKCRGRTQNIRFHGYLDERGLSELLRGCDVGIVPMFPESCVGVPGKLADYAAAGLRVIESLGGECREIVARHGAGVAYRAGDAASFRAAVDGVRSTRAVSDPKGWRCTFDARAVMDEYVAWCASAAGVRCER